MYPIILDDCQLPCMWEAIPAVKLQIFTSDDIVGLSGGAYVSVEGGESKTNPDEEEPIFFHNLPVKFAREHIHCYPCKRAIDLTPADG